MSSSLKPPRGQRKPLVYASSRATEQWQTLFGPGARPIENMVGEAILAGRVSVRGGAVFGDGFVAAVSRQPSLFNRSRNAWQVLAVRRPSAKDSR